MNAYTTSYYTTCFKRIKPPSAVFLPRLRFAGQLLQNAAGAFVQRSGFMLYYAISGWRRGLYGWRACRAQAADEGAVPHRRAGGLRRPRGAGADAVLRHSPAQRKSPGASSAGPVRNPACRAGSARGRADEGRRRGPVRGAAAQPFQPCRPAAGDEPGEYRQADLQPRNGGKARRAAFAGPADGTLLRRLPRWQDAADRG